MDLKNVLPKVIFQKYFKFGFVRDPWDLQVSLYNFMLQREDHFQYKLIKSMNSFDEYINWRVNDDLHLQKDFFYDGRDCLVDFVGKFENLNTDYSEICNKIGINEHLPFLNFSKDSSTNYIDYYSQKSIDIIHQAFIDDIELFGYSKPIK